MHLLALIDSASVLVYRAWDSLILENKKLSKSELESLVSSLEEKSKQLTVQIKSYQDSFQEKLVATNQSKRTLANLKDRLANLYFLLGICFKNLERKNSAQECFRKSFWEREGLIKILKVLNPTEVLHQQRHQIETKLRILSLEKKRQNKALYSELFRKLEEIIEKDNSLLAQRSQIVRETSDYLRKVTGYTLNLSSLVFICSSWVKNLWGNSDLLKKSLFYLFLESLLSLASRLLSQLVGYFSTDPRLIAKLLFSKKGLRFPPFVYKFFLSEKSKQDFAEYLLKASLSLWDLLSYQGAAKKAEYKTILLKYLQKFEELVQNNPNLEISYRHKHVASLLLKRLKLQE